MKQATITLDEKGVPVHLTVDGGPPTPINAFVFLSNVPTDPPAGHILAYGNSDTVGRLLFNFWRNSIDKDPAGAMTIEMVARDIVEAANSARKPWPGETGGMSH